jgi:riboflavin synthase
VFTGIIAGIGVVNRVTRHAQGSRLHLELPAGFDPLKVGDSLAIDGACLTAVGGSAVDAAGSEVEVEAIAETLRRTTLGRLEPGSHVNLEPALAMGGRLHGHWVQGHVDGTARLTERRREGTSERFAFELAAPELGRYIVPKGSIALAGVSLTVGETDAGGRFAVYLIPHTLTATTLGGLRAGAAVNVEVDILAKYVAHLLARDAGMAEPAATTAPALAGTDLLDFLRQDVERGSGGS